MFYYSASDETLNVKIRHLMGLIFTQASEEK